MPSDLTKAFKNPGKDYRSAPFWSWNDRMSAVEVRRQVRDMKAHGMGGFFMHSRVGLETRYMGPEWMRAIRAAVDEAAKIGMNAWLYDEDRWASGLAGGAVPGRGDAGIQKYLALRIRDKDAGLDNDVLCTYAVQAGKPGKRSFRRLAQDEAPRSGEMLFAFHVVKQPPTAWHNNHPYSDNMSAESVHWFIEAAYAPYADALKKHLGGVVPGIFTDEPHFAARGPQAEDAATLPWTPNLPEQFRKRRGWDLLDRLPSLFLDDEHSLKTRHDYWRTVTEVFVENYSKQLGTWCRKSGLQFTGHYLAEGTFAGQIAVAGAVMPHYVWQETPGIDILTESRGEDNITAKQCASVAAQFGRKWVLSELYGCTGWEFTFEGIKWVGNWQYALGVNLRCPHLALYTLRGCAKRDYPPSFNYNTTWWKYNRVHEDYFARLGLMLTQGVPVRDVLVVHPIASAWAEYDGANSEGADRWNRYFETTFRTLLSHHCDFDFGDEMIMADHADVVKDTFRIKKMRYKGVVLPPMLTISSSTVALLERFLAAGGHVVAVKPLATMVDAGSDRGLGKLWKHKGLVTVDSPAELPDALERALPTTVSVKTMLGQEAASTLTHLRRAGKRRILFVCNVDREAPVDTRITFGKSGRVEEWNLLTGEQRLIAAHPEDEGVAWDARFAPAGSKLYVIDTAGKALPERPAPASEGIRSRHDIWPWWTTTPPEGWGALLGETHLGPEWRFKRTDPNVLVLDVCRYRLRGSRPSKPMPVWQAQDAVRQALGLRSVVMNGGVQRWTWVDNPKDVGLAPTEYHFSFEVHDVPASKLSLLLEGSEHFTITLNGKRVPTKKSGWYLDRSMHRVALPRLRQGTNTLVLSCETAEPMQVEDCFLLGDFGLDAPGGAMTAEPEALQMGDWSLQRYPHYAGGMIYKTTFTAPRGTRHALLGIRDFSATVIAVRLNGKDAGSIPWRAAAGLNISKHLKAGTNRLEIEVMGSPRNMLGPLHHARGKVSWTGCAQFRTTGEDYTPDYVLHPWGLMGLARVRCFGPAEPRNAPKPEENPLAFKRATGE